MAREEVLITIQRQKSEAQDLKQRIALEAISLRNSIQQAHAEIGSTKSICQQVTANMTKFFTADKNSTIIQQEIKECADKILSTTPELDQSNTRQQVFCKHLVIPTYSENELADYLKNSEKQQFLAIKSMEASHSNTERLEKERQEYFATTLQEMAQEEEHSPKTQNEIPLEKTNQIQPVRKEKA